MQWYYKSEGKDIGPITEFELHKRAKRGALQANDLVWSKSFGEKWVTASSVPGLIEEKTESDKPKLGLVSQPRAAKRKQMKTFKAMLDDGTPVSVLAGKMKDLGIGMSYKPKRNWVGELPVRSISVLVLLSALACYLYVYQSSGIAKLFMEASSVFGVDLREQAVRARAEGFGQTLVSLRNKGQLEASDLLMGFIAPQHPSSKKFVDRLWQEYGTMTRDNCAVKATVQKIDFSATNQRATIMLMITILKDDNRSNRAMRTIWQVTDNNWFCMPE